MENNTVNNFESLKKRILIFLEESDWERAKEYCEKCLDTNPESAEVYLFLTLAELKLSNPQKLAYSNVAISENANFKKAIRYSSDEYRKKLEIYECENIYNRAYNTMQNAYSISKYNDAIELFDKIPNFKDSSVKITKCKESISSLKMQNQKNKKTASIFGIIALFIAIVISIVLGIKHHQNEIKNQQPRDERAKVIASNFNGLSFGKKEQTIFYEAEFRGMMHSDDGYVNVYAGETTETTNYSFSDDIVNYEYKKEASMNWRGEMIMTDTEKSEDSEKYSGEYKVSISKSGEITVHVQYQTLTVSVDENDIPTSISYLSTTYVPKTSYSYEEEDRINRMSNGVERY